MKNWKNRVIGLTAAIALLAIGYVAFYFLYLDFVVDYWWHQSLGYSQYFILRIVYRYLVFISVTFFFFLLFFMNFWIASRFLGAVQPDSVKQDTSRLKRYKKLAEMFRTGSLKVYAPLSLALAIFIALPLFEKWEDFLFYLFGPNVGATDPAYGIDASFFLFSLPIYTLLEQRLLITLLIVIAASLLLYWLERRLIDKTEKDFPRGAKIHLNMLALIFVFLFSWRFLLQRYELLFNAEHMPLFFGPGFTQMNITLPLIWITLFLWVIAAIGGLFFINFRKGLIPVLILVLVFCGFFGLKHTGFFTGIVQKYIVLPNELSREKPYIEKSVAATLGAYNLSNVETRNFEVEQIPWTETAEAIRMNIQNIPVWDRKLLDDVYDQLQSIRPYYNFVGVDVDRYNVGGRYQQVNLSGREINLDKLSGSGRNWINRHLQYTHGYGVVMTPAAQSGEELMVWFIDGISPRSDYGFDISEPGIYYGLEDHSYAIAPNDAGEMDYPMGDSFVTSNYEGEVGVPIDSLFRKLIFSIYFKDQNIFFTTKTGNDSKILFRRNIREAINALTPFLDLDRDPYLVVTSDGLFWIQDAYTKSKWYPYAAPYDGKHNYIRNSIKIVVDAYNGTIDYYISDPEDPIAQAYARMYPDLLKPISRMPDALKDHIRYPKDIFEIQMDIYRKYHQANPETFYREEDVWEFAQQTQQEIRDIGSQSMRSYYLTLNLIQKEKQEFLLLSPMSPLNRPNLRALAIAGCDGDHYGKFYVYSFPKGEQVYGPAQISALIDQDTAIAEQFTLWDQAGSEVKRGRMIILPIGELVFYIQPVYLSASAKLKIPQLQRLIVSQGDVVAMDVSLEKAFSRIQSQLKEKRQRRQTTMPTEAPAETDGQNNHQRRENSNPSHNKPVMQEPSHATDH